MELKNKYIRFMKYKNTYGLAFKFKNKSKMIIWQFSLKNMWLIPKVDKNYMNNSVLYGWLFFYIGYSKEAYKYI